MTSRLNNLLRCFLIVVAAAALTVGPLRTCHAQAPTKEEFEKALALELPEDPATIIAVVGDSRVLLGDVKGKVDARINSVTKSTKQQVPEDQLKYARVNLTRGFLAQTIQTKAMRECFLLSQVGTQSAEKRQEAAGMMASRARQMFMESEVPELLKRYKVNDMTELDKMLREEGTSLYQRQRDFADAMLGHMYVREAVDREPKVSLAEIHDHYEANRTDYQHASKARWEQLTVLFSNFPDREAAQGAIASMGRESFYGGSMQSVARSRSQEPLAKSGGVHDWTNQGSLASEKLDEAIFSLPVGEMSEIIADDLGLHIVRVLERKPAGVTPLSDLQEDIRKEIQQQKVAKSQREMMDKMLKLVPIWSLFPEDVPGAKPLPKQIAAKPPATKLR